MPKAKQSQFKLKNTFAAFSQGRKRIISKELQGKISLRNSPNHTAQRHEAQYFKKPVKKTGDNVSSEPITPAGVILIDSCTGWRARKTLHTGTASVGQSQLN